MKQLLLVACVAVLMVSIGAPVEAEQEEPAPTYESVIAQSWKSVHDKILAMAKDTMFPDDKLGWKPHLDSRSVIEELRHVTVGLEMTTALAKGEEFDFEAHEKAAARSQTTRAAVVAAMEKAIAASYSLVESDPSTRLVSWLEHQGEHYGKLVTAYRVNGIVPPASRQN